MGCDGTRLHSTLGYVSPMTFEQRWFAAQQQEGKSAQLTAHGVRTTGARSYRPHLSLCFS
jgi:hypothetical protein